MSDQPSSQPLSVALVAGGTGGHIFPALAVARALMRRNISPIFLTDSRGMNYLSDIDDMPCHELTAADPRGGTAKALWQMPQAVAEARRTLQQLGPQTVIGFGGYATLAVMVAARLSGIPTCLHEQNAVLGRVNRLMARFTDAVALTWENTALVPSGAMARCQVTGNPVRDIFLNKSAEAYSPPGDEDAFRLLVIGSSPSAAGTTVLKIAAP